jgi:sigma-B regulation protein RsbU (phosphoserine phosphatase)
MERLQLRARASVALADGDRLMATLTAAMSDGPREWTDDEVALVEAVATQLRTAVEMTRVHQREHAIAQQLQNALQPALPGHVPGLSVGRLTRPALDEASVGGDFYDLFPLDKNLFAVVIGDVSGKGLAAAQQLALIRNSLRTTLYLYREPAQAATALNKIVTSHDLLVGFVTVWVGVYDAATGQITYCSCGHEPGLVRRAGGAVEATETTGPPLGVAEGAEYDEKTVTLSSGDTFLLYTDGISEAGPSRHDLLGTKGLARLLAGLDAGAEVQAQADALFVAVSVYTNGVFRDDVAFLLLRRE